MIENEIRVPTTDGQMLAFTARPDGAGPFPVAVLFMDGVGYREQIKQNARRFAADGYYCVAPDFYYRSGDRISFDFTRMAEPEYRAEMLRAVAGLSPDAALHDTRAALSAVRDDPAAAEGPKVSVGYCMGARLALHAAAAMPDTFVAVAGIHPGALVTEAPDSPHHDLASVQGEIYVAFAEQDRTATPEVIDRFREEQERQRVRGTVERLPGTAHGFAMADLPVYDHDAAEHHFDRTLDLWRRALA
jgi:carboxymethylenebutenolidase